MSSLSMWPYFILKFEVLSPAELMFIQLSLLSFIQLFSWLSQKSFVTLWLLSEIFGFNEMLYAMLSLQKSIYIPFMRL